jgi:mRNA interferase RelE/StbE
VSSAWTIELTEIARKNLANIGHADAVRIRRFLDQRVATVTNPRLIGKPLTGKELGGFWRYRVGDYRIICDVQDNKLVVLVIEIGHRREIYR